MSTTPTAGERDNRRQVMASKIHVPLAPLLVRTRLNDTLDRLKNHRLGLVVAPAGSGKTSLLVQFVSPLYFALIDGGSAAVVWLAVLLGLNLAHDLMYGPQGAWFCELFDTRVRYSGVSVGSQVGAAVGGGVMPLVASWSLATAGEAGAVLCLAVSGLVAFLSAWFADDTAEADSNLDRPPDEGELAAAERDHPVAER